MRILRRWPMATPLGSHTKNDLKRKESVPVSRMAQWCVMRSRRAIVIFASPNMRMHAVIGQIHYFRVVTLNCTNDGLKQNNVEVVFRVSSLVWPKLELRFNLANMIVGSLVMLAPGRSLPYPIIPNSAGTSRKSVSLRVLQSWR